MCAFFTFLSLMWIVCISCITSVCSIRCYQCYMAEHPYFLPEGAQVKTCNDFDYSEAFIQDCPDSTFCFKKTATDHYYKQKFVREERGCAKQIYRGQKFDFHTGWSDDSYIVSDAYKIGCKMEEGFGLRTTKVEICHCNADFCNYSQSVFSLSSNRLICTFLASLLMALFVK